MSMPQPHEPVTHLAYDGAALTLGVVPDDQQQDPKLCADAQGRPFWRAITCDPVFLTDSPAQPIAPGWYQVSVRMGLISGLLAGPRLYLPDEAGHFSEARAIELALDGEQYVGRFYLPRQATRLRFDPSIYPCDFTCGPLELTPVKGTASWQASLGRLLHFQPPSTRLFRQWCRTGW